VGSVLVLACGDPAGSRPPEEAPTGVVSFVVFGDAPYSAGEEVRVQALIRDVGLVSPRFFLHVGDILGSPCSDEAYAARRAALERLPVPVVYTPGDNEWADCHGGGHDPLERLESVRAHFFTGPWAQENRRALALESQDAVDSLPYPENVRFQVGSVVFATAHIIGSSNGTRAFRGRGDAHDREVRERTRASLDWLRSAFGRAREVGAPLLVLAFHGDPFFEAEPEERPAFQELVELLATEAVAFDGQVLVIHGDSHIHRLDRPLRDPRSGETVENLARLEAWGSPDVGWAHVLVDTLAAHPVTVRSYACPGRWGVLRSIGVRPPEHCVRVPPRAEPIR
jgi:hypothetical protein